MGAETDQLTSLFSLILLGIIFIAIIFLLGPQLKEILNGNKPKTIYDVQSNTTLQPLQRIFLEYRHNSVGDWIHWIKDQDISLKNIAFNNLVTYLDGAPEDTGVLISEVIKAVIAFKYPESFTSINRLLANVRKHWGRYHTADQFYIQATRGLVELNAERAQSVLIEEFELIKNKSNPQKFMTSILDALSKLTSNDELDSFWFKVLKDPYCDLPVKEYLIELLKEQISYSRVAVVSQVFKFWNNSEMRKIPDADLKILEKLFHSNLDLIINSDYELWDLALDACDKQLTEKLFVSLITAVLETTPINEELLLQLFDAENIIRRDFLEALAKRHKLSEEEVEMIKAQYLITIKKSSNIIDLKKYKKDKRVPELLNDPYQYLLRSLSLGQEFKNSNLPILNLILGHSLSDKQYIIECLAANYNNTILSVNLPELLSSIIEPAKLKPLINQNKPCIIYFYGVSELIDKKFNDLETANLELLNNLFKELKMTMGINFLANLEISHEELTANSELQELFQSIFKLKYGLIKDVNKPNISIRQKVLSDHLKQVSPNRVKSNEELELLVKQTEDYSLIEFLTYINSYMKLCLLVYGELKSPADLNMPMMDLDDETDEDIEEVSI